jgi:microcystin-dependent protein
MSDPFVAEIRMFAGSFAPKGWATCDGQLLPISQNTALFSLLGTYYGGDGKSTFALPNLQGSSPLGQGQSTTGTEYFLGQQSGTEYVTLLQTEMPVHTHFLQDYTDDPADLQDPGPQTAIGLGAGLTPYIAQAGNQNATLNFQATSVMGSSLPHNNMMPYLTVTFIIAMQGVYPPRG